MAILNENTTIGGKTIEDFIHDPNIYDSFNIVDIATKPGSYKICNPTTYPTGAPYGSSSYKNWWYQVIEAGQNNTTTARYFFHLAGNMSNGAGFSGYDLYYRKCTLTISTGSVTYGSWNAIWNASNDGSGSSLDADLLDGRQANNFIHSVVTGTLTNASAFNTTTTLGFAVVNGGTNAPDTSCSYWGYLNLPCYSSIVNSTYIKQIAYPYGGSTALAGKLYVRDYNNGTWSAWNEIGSSRVDSKAFTGTSTGSSTDLQLVLTNYVTGTTLEDFDEVVLKLATDISANATLQLSINDTLTSKIPIYIGDSPITAGQCKNGEIITLRYNSGTSRFIVQGKGGGESVSPGTKLQESQLTKTHVGYTVKLVKNEYIGYHSETLFYYDSCFYVSNSGSSSTSTSGTVSKVRLDGSIVWTYSDSSVLGTSNVYTDAIDQTGAIYVSTGGSIIKISSTGSLVYNKNKSDAYRVNLGVDSGNILYFRANNTYGHGTINNSGTISTCTPGYDAHPVYVGQDGVVIYYNVNSKQIRIYRGTSLLNYYTISLTNSTSTADVSGYAFAGSHNGFIYINDCKYSSSGNPDSTLSGTWYLKKFTINGALVSTLTLPSKVYLDIVQMDVSQGIGGYRSYEGDYRYSALRQYGEYILSESSLLFRDNNYSLYLIDFSTSSATIKGKFDGKAAGFSGTSSVTTSVRRTSDGGFLLYLSKYNGDNRKYLVKLTNSLAFSWKYDVGDSFSKNLMYVSADYVTIVTGYGGKIVKLNHKTGQEVVSQTISKFIYPASDNDLIEIDGTLYCLGGNGGNNHHLAIIDKAYEYTII